MSDDPRSWLDEVFEVYGGVRLWVLAVLGPGLAVSELLQGRGSLGLGLGFICVAIWAKLAKQLGIAGQAGERIGNVAVTVGVLVLTWHYLAWWIEFLK